MNKIAIVVGHDKIEQGAYSNFLEKTEFQYNSEVAKLLPFDIYFRDEKIKGYTSKVTELANRINKKHYDLVVELHFNSFNTIANGSEALYYKNSKLGQRHSEVFVNRLVSAYGNFPRGAKMKIETDRGGVFLKKVNAPCIIVEPFFGDNKEALLFKDVNKYAKFLIDTFC